MSEEKDKEIQKIIYNMHILLSRLADLEVEAELINEVRDSLLLLHSCLLVSANDNERKSDD